MRGMRSARAGRNPASSDCGSALRPVRVRGAACHATARHHAAIARRTPMTRTCASKLRDEGERPAGLGLCKASSSSGVISAAPATLLSSESAACTRTKRVSVPAVCQCCDSAESRGRVPAAALALSASPGQPSVPPCCRRIPCLHSTPLSASPGQPSVPPCCRRIPCLHSTPLLSWSLSSLVVGPRFLFSKESVLPVGMREKSILQNEGTHHQEAVADGSSRSPQVSKQAGFGSTMAAATGHTVAGLLAAACVATACSAGAALHFLPPRSARAQCGAARPA